MTKYFLQFITAISLVCLTALISCCGRNADDSRNGYVADTSAFVDTAKVSKEMPDSMIPDNPKQNADLGLSTPSEVREYMSNLPDASRYAGGVLESMAENAPEYASKILGSAFDKFLVVDKARMKVLLYDRYGQVIRDYDMACAKNYGTKHKKADSRTPEGFFSVEGKYDSTDWLFTDDEGVTSKKKGQFGPRFIRIKTPITSQIGIHGTCSPWSIGHRTSHGCIRILNENILELVNLVDVGMPVIVLPGKRDRQANRDEGYEIPYFPTAPKYAMSQEEKGIKVKTKEEIEEEKLEKERLEAEQKQLAEKARLDSLAEVRRKAAMLQEDIDNKHEHEEENQVKEKNDSTSLYF